jgi:hypothetical protein
LLAIVVSLPFFVRPIPSTKNNLQGLSTLKIKVKRRLRIRCHRPAVSSGREASVACLTAPKGEANA